MSTKQSFHRDQGRRSSVRLNYPQNVDLILSPGKPPLSEIKVETACVKAETVTKIIESRSKKQRLSDLILLQKTGRSDAIVNLTNHEFNFLINQLIPLVSEHAEVTVSASATDKLCAEIEEGKKMTKELNNQICDFELKNVELVDKVETLSQEVDSLRAEAEFCRELLKSTLELTELVAVGDLDFRLEQYRLENLTRLSDFDVILSDLKAKVAMMKAKDIPQEHQEVVDVETEYHRESVFKIVSDEGLEDSMPELEIGSEDEGQSKEEPKVLQMSEWLKAKVVPQPDVPSTWEVYALVSEILDNCAFSAVNRSDKGSRETIKQWGKRFVKDAPMAFEVMTPEEAKQFESLEDKRNNHFAILLTGMQVPDKVKKLETVKKYEREYAINMAKNIYPQFHESCIKHIKSLKPQGQPWTIPYSLKVTFKSEHVRQHVLAGAAHANLLVRPYMNPRQFEMFRERQKERYQVKGTNEPGPAFLVNGGYVPKPIHPSMEAGFEAWEKEYQRRKQFPKREIVLGGRRGRTKNMTTVTIDMPADPVEDAYWSNALERAYQRHVSTRPAPMPFNGPLQSVPHTSTGRAAPTTAATATWPSTWHSQNDFIQTLLAPYLNGEGGQSL